MCAQKISAGITMRYLCVLRTTFEGRRGKTHQGYELHYDVAFNSPKPVHIFDSGKGGDTGLYFPVTV